MQTSQPQQFRMSRMQNTLIPKDDTLISMTLILNLLLLAPFLYTYQTEDIPFRYNVSNSFGQMDRFSQFVSLRPHGAGYRAERSRTWYTLPLNHCILIVLRCPGLCVGPVYIFRRLHLSDRSRSHLQLNPAPLPFWPC